MQYSENVVNFENAKNLLKLSVRKFTVGDLIYIDIIEQCKDEPNVFKINQRDKKATLFKVTIVSFVNCKYIGHLDLIQPSDLVRQAKEKLNSLISRWSHEMFQY